MGNDLSIAEWLKPYLPLLAAIIRGGIQLAAGGGFVWAMTVSADQVTMITTITAAIISLGWSIWEKEAAKRAAQRAEVAAGKASADATLATGKRTVLTVIETPGDLPNKAVPVPLAEIAAAPAVPVPAPASPR